ncbi:MAG: AI-2E family transporter [Patescibacteria group bacterium]|nr:AI-2E family transporter [Patescibacteria group bacterium]
MPGLQTTFFFGLLIITFALVVRLAQPYLPALVLAGTLAIIFWPIHRRIRAIISHRVLAAFVSMVLVLAGVLLPFIALTAVAVIEAQQLIEILSHGELFNHSLSQISGAIQSVLGELSPSFRFESLNVDESLRQILNFFIAHAGTVLSGIAGTLLQLIVFLYALYYFFKEGEHLPNLYLRLSPLPDLYDKKIVERVHTMVTSVIQGSVLLATIQGVLTGLGFAMFGIPAPVLWGMVTIPISFVPWFGTAITIVPAIFYLLISGHMGAAIGLTLWGGIVVGFIDNLLNPTVIGSRAKVNPLLVLISVLGGLQVFGPMGFLTGPIVLSIFLALLEIYQQAFRGTYLKMPPAGDR